MKIKTHDDRPTQVYFNFNTGDLPGDVRAEIINQIQNGERAKSLAIAAITKEVRRWIVERESKSNSQPALASMVTCLSQGT